ncbi:PucR family transcriptional regulator [Nocardioides sambongensis]|uniref:PucR family transcriptional regulator n=1 Tax=Nocardioides sambongensis TaxID=2589074 RepID=UPI00112A3878|nr:helix-turn-helix domain-containing protein [Nocardioides sambongensis]
MAAASTDGLERHRAARIAGALAAEHHGLGGVHGGRAVVVVPSGAGAAHQLRDRLAAAGAEVTVGWTGADTAAEGWAEACRCVDALVALGRSGEVSDPAGLGLARLLLGTSGPEELDDFVAATIGPVVDYDARRGTELVATMEAWFGNAGALRATAEALHVHPNTVTQRLDRIGRLLDGEQWRSPDRALDFQLALRLRRLTR